MDYNSSRSVSSPLISIESTSLSTCTDNPLLHCTPLTNSSTPSFSPAIQLILPDGRAADAEVKLEAEGESETGKLALARLLQHAFLAYIAPLEPLLLGLPANVLVLALMSRRSVRVTQRARFFYLLVAAADFVVHATYGLVLNVLMEVRSITLCQCNYESKIMCPRICRSLNWANKQMIDSTVDFLDNNNKN